LTKEYKIAKPNKALDSQIFSKETGFSLFTRGDEFFVGGCNSQDEAEQAIAAHNPPAPTEPTVAEKLASVGLSVDDLKTALGLA
jgi:hypothetical protein